MTRAALRAQAQDEVQLIHEDADAEGAPESPNPCADQDVSRPALKDITHENYPTTDDLPTDEQTAAKQNAENKKQDSVGKTTGNNTGEEVPEQQNTGHEQSRGLLLDEQPQEVTAESKDVIELVQCSDDTPGCQNNQSAAAAAVEYEFSNIQLHISTVTVGAATPAKDCPFPTTTTTSTPHAGRTDPLKTPKFDPDIHPPVESAETSGDEPGEDSFIEKIKSRSPNKMQIRPDERNAPEAVAESTVINSRSLRIEDSVEAIDALEDAIEEISEKLPALEELKIDSPVKSRATTPARPKQMSERKTPATLKKTSQTPARTPRLSTTKPATAPKLAATKRESVAKSAPRPSIAGKSTSKPIVDGIKPRQSSASSQPPLTFSNSPAAKNLPNTTKKRGPSGPLSTSKPGFVPAKSAKAPTRPTFSLPGEAISAKVKAQREERLKREEEAERERKTFKARPMPTKVSRPSVVPRENKASQARLSIFANGVNKENVAPKPRYSSIDIKPKSDTTKVTSASRRSTSVIEKSTIVKTRVSSLQLAAGQKLTVTKEDAAQQKAKGKEVFARAKIEMEKAEKERKDKEEAARKARAEAAERGRQASREWAEKHKKKLAAQIAAKMSVQAKATTAS